MRHPLESALPGTAVLGAVGAPGNGAEGQSELEVLAVRADGVDGRIVIRSPRIGSLGMEAGEDCAARVLSLFRTRGLPHCAEVRAVWGVDAAGRVIDLREVSSWHVAEAAVEGVPLFGLLAQRRPVHDLRTLFRRLGAQLAELHSVPVKETVSIRRGVHEALAGPDGAMAIFAAYPVAETGERREFIEDYLALATRAAWRLEERPERPTAVCHGDIHPGNILVDDDGRLAFIDRGRLKSCEPAADIGIVVANLIRFAFAPAADGTHGAALLDAFVQGYTGVRADMPVASLGYFVLTCMPAAVTPVFNPSVGPAARWGALRWIREAMAYREPLTVAEWLAAVAAVQPLHDRA